jgi:ABC-2 type transport system ATP-binding protein
LPGKRIDEVLEIVGLVGREGDEASTYSLGMKQRLGIAAAVRRAFSLRRLLARCGN